ncbi:hypothetical protein [Wolbachia endosymbiont (group A) of Epistrophe grossularia]|uniref:hypothetical protein n=1 Tax=Wolbachia endosymbiont (group A) of Epistrophe grossularia TaxID=2954008 RepID=UPI002231B584|nr:hypothetical protein [Wolbachia endosymbiont (group A) of Epistrophe grossularia]
MKILKKIWESITEKLRNKKGTTTAKVTDMEKSRTSDTLADVEEVKVEIKKQTNTVDKATETDTKLCNINSEDLQPICESNEEAQNDSTTVEPTSEPCFDRETNEQTPDSPSPTEPCFDATDEKDKPLTQQRQAIVIGSVVGAILLASSAALYIMKMPVVAAVVGIVGLACIGLALYNIINPNTKLEKVEEQSITAHPPLKAI